VEGEDKLSTELGEAIANEEDIVSSRLPVSSVSWSALGPRRYASMRNCVQVWKCVRRCVRL
jgi:hypothetical protein